MPVDIKQYRVLIASPSDLKGERKAIPEIISHWNNLFGPVLKLNLYPVMWETHATPEMGDRPQAILNRQIVETSDILIGVFWTKIGSNTGVEESGTVEEIKQFMQSGKPTLLYFSSAKVAPENLDAKQYKKVLQFKGELQNQGLFFDYKSIPELKMLLSSHITNTLTKIHDGKLDSVATTESLYINQVKPQWSTTQPLAAFKSAISENKPNALGTANEFLRQLAFSLAEFDLMQRETAEIGYEANLLSCLSESLPLRDEYIDFITFVSQFSQEIHYIELIHEFFANTLKYFKQDSSYNFDAIRMIVTELFLYTVAALVKQSRFNETNSLISEGYLLSDDSDGQFGTPGLQTYKIFRPFLRSLEHGIPNEWGVGRSNYGITAKLLKERATSNDLPFNSLKDADFALFARSAYGTQGALKDLWFPVTADYIERNAVMPLFLKATYKAFFNKLIVLIGVKDKQELLRNYEAYCERWLQNPLPGYFCDPQMQKKLS